MSTDRLELAAVVAVSAVAVSAVAASVVAVSADLLAVVGQADPAAAARADLADLAAKVADLGLVDVVLAADKE
jgi:hypothetical protein